METFSALQALCAGNSPVPGEFPAQRPVTQSIGVFYICVWINGWVNNREAGDLRRNQAHYDVIVMVNYSSSGLKYIMLIIWYELFQLQSYSCMLILQDTRLDGPIMCTYQINVSNISVKLLYIIYSIRVKVQKSYQVVTDVGFVNCYPQGSFSLTLTLVPAWRSNQISGKGWYEKTYAFQNIKDCTVEVWVSISNFIPHFIIDAITKPCWDGIYSMLVKWKHLFLPIRFSEICRSDLVSSYSKYLCMFNRMDTVSLCMCCTNSYAWENFPDESRLMGLLPDA